MAGYWTWAYGCVFAFMVLKITQTLRKAANFRKIMPPGPPGVPFLGNVLQVQHFMPWIQFTEWKEKYSPIFSLNLAGQPAIVINDVHIASDLLGRRSKIYSGRQHFVMACEVLTQGLFIPVITDNDRWRRMRRAVQDGINTNTLLGIRSMQEEACALLVLDILRDPEHFEAHFSRAAASTMLRAIYGWSQKQIDTDAGAIVERANNLVHRVTKTMTLDVHLVEIFPALLRLPEWIARWKHEGREHFERDSRMFMDLMEGVKTNMQADMSSACLGAILIRDDNKYGLSQMEQAWAAGTALIGGTGTTAAALLFFVLAMTLHPDVMRRAQKSIDAVVGRQRLPVVADRDQLPWIKALIRELHRWRPITPLAGPRRASQDDWYGGYFIPEGTIVLPNVWAMNRDPKYFPDYEEFRPERYLDTSGQLIDLLPAETHGQGHMTFSSGRRICPGRELANQALFIACATLLWAFDIEPSVDAEGGPIFPSRTECVDTGFFVQPASFPCRFIPRGPEVVSVVQAAALSGTCFDIVLPDLSKRDVMTPNTYYTGNTGPLGPPNDFGVPSSRPQCLEPRIVNAVHYLCLADRHVMLSRLRMVRFVDTRLYGIHPIPKMGAQYVWAIFVGVIFATFGLIWHAMKRHQVRKAMPPGPPGIPLLGNALEIGSFQWLQFTAWKEQYGDIFSLDLAGQHVVVLNSLQATADLLDRRSRIYSSRPRFTMVNEIMTGGMAFPFAPYNDLWRRQRRAAHENFTARATVAYHSVQEQEAAALALRLLHDSEHWERHLKRSVACTMLRTVYGELDIDPVLDHMIEFTSHITHAALPGNYLVDIFPWMQCFPLWVAKWKRDGQRWFKEDTVYFKGLLEGVEAKLESNCGEPCFAGLLMREEKKYNLDRAELAWLAGVIFTAGTETTATAMSVFMLAAVLYPGVMRKAQAQLDQVIGHQRLPTLEDREKLPYIEAVVKEVLRWRPRPAWSSEMFHSACVAYQDDWYNGYFIPKDTVILTNIWAMNRDPEYFPDYDEFRPERYLNELGELGEPVPDTHQEGHISFGAGRRICVGKNIANQVLFLNFATLLWAFDIERWVGADGEPVTPSSTDCIDRGIVVEPVPFKCSIVPRSPEVASIISSATGARS
ncbi:hypothetical protein NM688_g801 [Phlebia brevispora]|uniref:Uncharacterized protein n=1 Tax=Phlebia brevispora TaxID=194682 RepID=A0ACC1TDL0_9APHY|nr:hypothetical protein NM688_g801 [Phlebia brevispora]